jgi:NAD+ diphosphatase
MSDTEAEISYVFRGGDLVLPGDPAAPGGAGGAHFPAASLAGLRPVARRLYPSGGRVCEALRLSPDAPLPELPGTAGGAGPRALPFRAALGELSPEESGRAAKALALLNWLAVSAHCGACGAPLEDDKAEGFVSGARRCTACGRIFYPRISPAVIVLVSRGGKILLAHNASFPEGRFGLIAGFVETGEALEAAARRELMEETGIEVGELRYRGSQPWPFPDSLMVAFETEWRSGEARPDGVELTELRWCGPDELPSIPPPGSVARRLIDGFTGAACASAACSPPGSAGR